nr:hypothetical protein BCU62_11770 [Enterovibrio norvegicus]
MVLTRFSPSIEKTLVMNFFPHKNNMIGEMSKAYIERKPKRKWYLKAQKRRTTAGNRLRNMTGDSEGEKS